MQWTLPVGIISAVLFAGCRDSGHAYTFNVMAPLHVMQYHDWNKEEARDWELFGEQLRQAAEIGVDAVSVDVWWGTVQAEGPDSFEWDYYHRIFDTILTAGLGLVPIISLHSFDPGPESELRAPVPDWVWDHLSEVSGRPVSDLRFVSEDLGPDGQLLVDSSFVAPWADEWAMPLYQNFVRAFTREFIELIPHFQELNISCGPTGELRFPSYSGHDGGGFPNRGRLQCFSALAMEDYARFSADSVDAPELRMLVSSLIPKGQFGDPALSSLLRWYNRSLMLHGNRMLRMALAEVPEEVPIGFKIPGIHWRIADTLAPRVAEISCGLIDGQQSDAGKAYKQSIAMAVADLPLERLVLHFTCLEQANGDPGQDSLGMASRARDLVYEVARAAGELGLTLKGENAATDDLASEAGWSRMQTALLEAHYSGLTILRINEIHSENPGGREAYSRMIKRMGSN